MCCALPSCEQGLAEPGPPRIENGESQWCYLWVMVLLLSIWVCFLLGRGLTLGGSTATVVGCPVMHPLSRGPRWVEGLMTFLWVFFGW